MFLRFRNFLEQHLTSHVVEQTENAFQKLEHFSTVITQKLEIKWKLTFMDNSILFPYKNAHIIIYVLGKFFDKNTWEPSLGLTWEPIKNRL